MNRLGFGVVKVREFVVVFFVRSPRPGQSGRRNQQIFTDLHFENPKSDDIAMSVSALSNRPVPSYTVLNIPRIYLAEESSVIATEQRMSGGGGSGGGYNRDK